jgi:translation initiation factor IF-2
VNPSTGGSLPLPAQDRGSGLGSGQPAAGAPAHGHSNGVAPGPQERAAPPGRVNPSTGGSLPLPAQDRGSGLGSGKPAAAAPANGHSNGVAPGPQERAAPQGPVLEDRPAPVVEDSTAPAALVAQAPANQSATAPSSPVPPSAVLLEPAGAAPVLWEADGRGAHDGPLAAAGAAPGMPAVAYPPALTLSEQSFFAVSGSPTATLSASALAARPSGSAVSARPSSPRPLPAPGGATASGGAAGPAAATLFGVLLAFAAYCLLHHMRLRIATCVCRPQAFVAVIERPG